MQVPRQLTGIEVARRLEEGRTMQRIRRILAAAIAGLISVLAGASVGAPMVVNSWRWG